MTVSACALQMVSTDCVAENLENCAELITQAVLNHSYHQTQNSSHHQAKHQSQSPSPLPPQLIVLPEDFALMARDPADKLAIAEQHGHGHIQDFLANQARQHKIWLIAGSIPLRSPEPHRVFSSCLVYDPHGDCIARYNKIHLFDVHVQDNIGRYQESSIVMPGNDCVVIDTPLAKIGLAICYDVRFPELFRKMMLRGAQIIVLPAAFTAITGAAHWDVLLRARAIENLAYVIAAGQGGTHVNGRQTFGHSCLIDPWGNILNSLATGPGVVAATLDIEGQTLLRQQFPALHHHRLQSDHEP